ncbi:hypothetical protein BCV70DRAFT_196669 [Testicularia cyperi]|uniref:Fe2OG dioxygenase domain-containing protein n=1 Tax=Testicularia cyperi TaxID=1882483 RepID=A0A317XG18_9BASI|nr:hypothetical protein BCV70DRAFT_196669 [Testicularia cyperi]
MQDFLNQPCVQRIQAYCNKRFFESFPEHASFYRTVGGSQHFKPYQAFKWGPCFPSLAINEEVNAISAPHRDRRDFLQGLAGVLSIGSYKRMTLNFHEAKVTLELPPGSLCFFPSHVLHHYNTPVEDGETRGSLTMFMSTDVVKWAGYGGKACETPQEVKNNFKAHCHSQWSLFQTIDHKKH